MTRSTVRAQAARALGWIALQARSRYVVYGVMLVAKVALARFLIFGAAQPFSAVLWREAALVAFMLGLVEFLFRGDVRAYAVADLLFSVMLTVVVVFSGFYERLPSPDAVALVGQAGAVHESVTALLEPAMGLFFADLVFVSTVAAWRRRLPARRPLRARPLLVLLALAGGASMLLVSPVFADETADDLLAARRYGLLAHEAMLFTAPHAAEAASVALMDPDAVRSRFERLHGGERPIRVKATGVAEGRDLIVIQVESLQAFAVGLEVGGVPVTPNLDRLAKDSYIFDRVFQQVGAGNTSDAEYMLDTGLYPLETKAVAITYGARRFPGMPRLLGDIGYDTATFHTDRVTYWNRDELYPSLGYEEHFDRPFFGDEDLRGLGPSDDVLFEKAEPVLRTRFEAGRPFYARFMTMTSHHPFTAQPRTLRLPERYRGTLAGDYLDAIHYTDAAIGRFIENLKRDGIYDRSVIVVTGDHAGLGFGTMDDDDLAVLEDVLGREYTMADRLRLPLLVAVPGVARGHHSTVTGGQVDVMPTVMNLLGVPLEGQVYAGTDLLNTSTNLVGIRFYMPTGTFVRDGVIFVPGAGFDDGRAYQLDDGPPMPTSRLRDDYDRVLEIQRLSDSYLATLPKRGVRRE